MNARRLLWIVVPVTGLLLTALCAVLLAGRDRWVSAVALAILMVPAGRFVLLAPAAQPSLPFSAMEFAPLVIAIDVSVAALAAGNLDLLLRVPGLGRALARVEAGGRALLERRPAIKRTAECAIVLFVAAPLPGTGSIGGTILARLVGFPPGLSLALASAGIVIGTYLVAAGGSGLAAALAPFEHLPYIAVVRYAVIALLLTILTLIGRRMHDEA